jgi:hypothetical protein
MFMCLTRVFISAACLVALAGQARAQTLRTVAVAGKFPSGMRNGVGLLRPRYPGECFVVTPRHVADPDSGGARAAGASETLDTLQSLPDRYSEDLSLWRMLRRVDRGNCPQWPSMAEVNRTLERAAHRRGARAYVIPWTPQGAGRAVEVEFGELTLPRFTIRQRRNVLHEGMSGSPVQVDGMIVGVLTEVSDSTDYGVVIRLDYVERHLDPFFDPSPSPDDAAIYASVLIPGLGQVRTRRAEAGLFWFGLAAVPTAYLFFETRNEQVARTRPLPDGREETYFETRPANPLRRYSWVTWLAAGLGSFMEARGHAGRFYIPPERSGGKLGRRPQVRLRPGVQPAPDGGARVQVAELRF